MGNKKIIDYDYEILLPPYWLVEYIDRDKKMHIVTTQDKDYLDYLKAYFQVISVKVVEA